MSSLSDFLDNEEFFEDESMDQNQENSSQSRFLITHHGQTYIHGNSIAKNSHLGKSLVFYDPQQKIVYINASKKGVKQEKKLHPELEHNEFCSDLSDQVNYPFYFNDVADVKPFPKEQSWYETFSGKLVKTVKNYLL